MSTIRPRPATLAARAALFAQYVVAGAMPRPLDWSKFAVTTATLESRRGSPTNLIIKGKIGSKEVEVKRSGENEKLYLAGSVPMSSKEFAQFKASLAKFLKGDVSALPANVLSELKSLSSLKRLP
jgi:hypothetical protein